MQLDAKKLDSANALITATVDSKTVAKSEEKIAAKYAKQAKVDGFRKGKVPVALIKQRFKDDLANDVRSSVAQEVVEAGLKKLGEVEMLGSPSVSRFDEKGDTIEIEVRIPTRPTIDLGDYMKHVPTHKEIKIDKKKVEEAIEKAAKSTAPLEEIKTKRALKSGDVAVLDFDGFVDGAPLPNGSAKNQELEIGSNSFIAGFEDQMIGMKIGEAKTLELKFPDEYHAKDIAGKEVKFDVVLHAIKTRKAPEINDELAKTLLPNMEGANLEKLYEVVEESMINEEKAKLFQDELKPKLLEAFTKHYNFDVPQTILDQEIEHLINQKARELPQAELEKLAQDQKEIEKLKDSVKDEAKDRVKTTLLIDAIAKAENISVTDQEAAQVIYYEAYRSGQNPKDMLDYYRKQNLLPVVKMSITEDKTLNALLEKKNSKPAKKSEEVGEEKPKKAPAKAKKKEEN